MIYTEQKINKFAELLAFTATPELYSIFLEQDRIQAAQVSDFHIMVTLLGSINDMINDQIEVTFINLSKYLEENVFKSEVEVIELEKRIQEFYPKLLEQGLITQKMEVTELGKKMLTAKRLAFYTHQNISEILN